MLNMVASYQRPMNDEQRPVSGHQSPVFGHQRPASVLDTTESGVVSDAWRQETAVFGYRKSVTDTGSDRRDQRPERPVTTETSDQRDQQPERPVTGETSDWIDQ